MYRQVIDMPVRRKFIGKCNQLHGTADSFSAGEIISSVHADRSEFITKFSEVRQ
jgi:hypothetical protein